MTDTAPSITPDTDRSAFDHLPGAEADTRCVGVEIEFGGLTPQEAADCVSDVVGGQVQRDDAGDIQVQDSRIGSVEIYLDTALRKKLPDALSRLGVGLSPNIVPVEIVTEPVAQSDLPLIDRIRDALRDAGANGTRDGLLLGYGVHLNVEIARDDGADVPRVGHAFALLEDGLRQSMSLDLSRRVLPFTRPYPTSWLDALAQEGYRQGPQDFFKQYADHNDDRNRGLDLLPIFQAIAPDLYDQCISHDDAVTGRPAYHYRLPDSRVDEADWSIALEWNRWASVERIAYDDALMDELTRDWRRFRQDGGSRRDWAEQAAAFLDCAPEAST